MTDNARMVYSALERSLDDAFRHIEINRDATIFEIDDIIRHRYGGALGWAWQVWVSEQNVEDS